MIVLESEKIKVRHSLPITCLFGMNRDKSFSKVVYLLE